MSFSVSPHGKPPALLQPMGAPVHEEVEKGSVGAESSPWP